MRNEEIKDLFEIHTKAIKAEVKATTDLLSYKIDGIIDRQDIANHRTTKLEDECERFDKHVCNTDKLWKARRWIAIVFFVVIFASSWLSMYIYHNVDPESTVAKKFGIVLKEKE